MLEQAFKWVWIFFFLLLKVSLALCCFSKMWVSSTRPIQQALISNMSSDFLMQKRGTGSLQLGGVVLINDLRSATRWLVQLFDLRCSSFQDDALKAGQQTASSRAGSILDGVLCPRSPFLSGPLGFILCFQMLTSAQKLRMTVTSMQFAKTHQNPTNASASQAIKAKGNNVKVRTARLGSSPLLYFFPPFSYLFAL